MCEVKELLIFFGKQHWEDWQDFDTAVDRCADKTKGMSRLVVFAVGLSLAVRYYVELLGFLVKEPNLCEIIQYETV